MMHTLVKNRGERRVQEGELYVAVQDGRQGQNPEGRSRIPWMNPVRFAFGHCHRSFHGRH
ncbi:hypothetical protein CCP4SC76_10005 [Gammaproteobacteria bacterium]